MKSNISFNFSCNWKQKMRINDLENFTFIPILMKFGDSEDGWNWKMFKERCFFENLSFFSESPICKSIFIFQMTRIHKSSVSIRKCCHNITESKCTRRILQEITEHCRQEVSRPKQIPQIRKLC